jgi:pyruvate kinase
MAVSAIVTIPPYASFIEKLVEHPLVGGLRLNTVMPLKEDICTVLARLNGFGKTLWVDLKGRQLRVTKPAIPPYTEIILSHRIRVDTPAVAYFSDGREAYTVAAVDENRLIMEAGPQRLIGPGESLNIAHPSLQIEGTLTETDKAYLSAMASLNMRHIMLSYVQQPSDADEVKTLLPTAILALKIESQAGLRFARYHQNAQGRLVAARGDLFVEVPQPHQIARAVRDIIHCDANAIVASRLFDSLAQSPIPSSADITDVAYLLNLGYRTFMLGDTICFRYDSIITALNLIDALAKDFAV